MSIILQKTAIFVIFIMNICKIKWICIDHLPLTVIRQRKQSCAVGLDFNYSIRPKLDHSRAFLLLVIDKLIINTGFRLFKVLFIFIEDLYIKQLWSTALVCYVQFNNFNNTSVIVESIFLNWYFGDCFLNKFCFYLIFGFPFKVYFFVSVYPTQKMGFLLHLN